MKLTCSRIAVLFSWVSTSVLSFTPLMTLRMRQPAIATTSLAGNDDATDDAAELDFTVMVNGMPGPMATAAAEACLRKGLDLLPVALTGPNVPPQTVTVHDTVSGRSCNVRLVPSSDTDEVSAALDGVRASLDLNLNDLVNGGGKNLLAIDYTHPSAVNSNANFYADQSIPFVMGTTGGDRDLLMKDMKSKGAFAVIAPNMGKQIVAMQSALEDLSERYPSAFAGYNLDVVESHQKTKADTSGTAKAVVASLVQLSDKIDNDRNNEDDNDSFQVSDIQMIRDDPGSLEFGVAPEHLNGHAFHTYTLTSPDKSVQFQLKHNVSGRTVYAEGTADAVRFLARKVRSGDHGDGGSDGGRIYTMVNVLEEGAME